MSDVYAARLKILEKREALIRAANEKDPLLVQMGGGMKDLDVRIVESGLGKMVITHILVDTRDAMGSQYRQYDGRSTGAYDREPDRRKVYLRNSLQSGRPKTCQSEVEIDQEKLGGEAVVDGIISAYAFAAADPHRAATHNKGL